MLVKGMWRITAVSAALAVAAVLATAPLGRADSGSPVRLWTIHYRAHDGAARPAVVVLPAWYGPTHDPPLPLVISPHGRGIDAAANARLWGNLPAEGGFVVVNPGGEGRRLALYSWGYRGQIDDLARMQAILRETLPWLHIDSRRVYAIGGSMGGQEVLLLVARHPRLLAGAAAFDAPTDMALRYADFPHLEYGRSVQKLAAFEIGGTPMTDARGYAARSPLDFAAAIARSGVPLELWWSVSDQIVVDQAANSGALYQRIRTLNPGAPVTEIVGCWMHSAEMTASSKLPVTLLKFGLLSESVRILAKAAGPANHAGGGAPAAGIDAAVSQ